MTDTIIKINATTTDADIREMVELASAAERLAAHNNATGKSTKKFASAAAGIKQTIKALTAQRDELAAHSDAEVDSTNGWILDELGFAHCPHCGEGVYKKGDNPGHDADMTHEYECLGCGQPLGRELSKARSAGVKRSWEDAEVAAKRTQRHAVEVDGVQYRSVRAAYLALELPLKEHIQFRMLLKENGQLENHGRTWTIVPKA